MSYKTDELRKQRVALAKKLADNLANPNQTVETRMAWKKMDEELTELTKQLRDAEDTENRSRALEIIRDRESIREFENGHEREYRMTFQKYMRRGILGLTEDERTMLRQYESRTDDQQASMWGRVTGQSYTGGNESGAGVSNSGIAGGFLVPTGFMYEIDTATKYYAPLLDGSVFRTVETAGGGLLPFPTSNDTANMAVALADAVQDTELAVPFGVVNFGAYKYSSRIIRVSLELIQDSAFNLESYLAEQFGVRFGRAFEAAFTTGTGSSQPMGLITAVLASGATPVVGSGSNSNDGLGQPAYSTIGSNDLISLEHSVDPTYRRGAKFMLADASLKVIKQLLDKYGRPLWVPGLSSNAPDTILGYPYVINQSMQTPAANTNPATVAFGNMNKYVVRKVKDFSMLRLNERYADYGQVGFIGFMRVDGNLVDAGTHPVNLLQQHS